MPAEHEEPGSSSSEEQLQPVNLWEGLSGKASVSFSMVDLKYEDLEKVFSRFLAMGQAEPYGCCGTRHCGQGAVPQ
jgi:hypothetical protein